MGYNYPDPEIVSDCINQRLWKKPNKCMVKGRNQEHECEDTWSNLKERETEMMGNGIE